jgi:hypothetical protein
MMVLPIYIIYMTQPASQPAECIIYPMLYYIWMLLLLLEDSFDIILVFPSVGCFLFAVVVRRLIQSCLVGWLVAVLV